MSKHRLMLSAATVALLSGQAFADTTISAATTKALTTGAFATGITDGTASAGNITIASGGSIDVSSTPGTTSTGAAITVNSSNFVYSDGAVTNHNVATGSGIRIDVSTNPNLSAVSFNNAAATAITGSGIYLDAGSALSAEMNSSSTGGHGIWLNAANGIGTYTGDITTVSGSTISLVGNTSQGLTIDNGATLAGNLSFGGTLSLDQTTGLSTTASGLYGVMMAGQVNGNIVVPSGGSIVVAGEGAQGMLISGTGVAGSITIGGSLTTESLSATSSSTLAQKQQTTSVNTIFPEAGTALGVGANVTNGIAILGNTYVGAGIGSGSISTQGLGPAVAIGPGLNTVFTTATAPLVIGVYTTNGTAVADTTDPGFSFDNRGTISAAPANVATTLSSTATSATGMTINGAAGLYPTVLTGGFFNSGTLSASVGTSGTIASAVTATGLYIGTYTTLDNATYNTTTSSWIDPHLLTGKITSDQAVLVNSNAAGGGTISASVSGSRGGTAVALSIATTANVPSIINSGTISGTVQNSDSTLDGSTATGGHPVIAAAIVDQSGTLTSIYNSGTIAAQASTLDNNKQIAQAINLSVGTPSSPSGSGVVITDQSVGATSAKIVGDILFGTGNNQIINVAGNGGSAIASITGNISYGAIGTGSTTGDKLNIGNYGTVSGIVTAPQGVSVDIKSQGLLDLLNTTTALNAATFHVANGGSVSLGVSESVADTGGMVQASQSITLDPGSNLGVAYASFVPQGNDSFVLFSAPHTNMNIDPGTIAVYNVALQKNVINGGSLPFLFQSANLQVTTSAAADKLVLNVVPKTSAQLGLTTGSYGAQMFAIANTALSQDDLLGSAMVNGITDVKSAQAAYNSFAPNVTGGSRAIAISITDQATGVVGAHQRALRLYGKQSGEETLWGEEFVQMIKDPGRGAVDPNTAIGSTAGYKVQSGYKDHGFGFALGLDGGSPKYGWYGGAFTFYAGDVGELGRVSHTNQQWYILSGYTDWRGRGLFFDSKLDVGYGHIDGKRFISLAIPQNTIPQSYSVYTREADNKHTGTLLSGGFTTGGILAYGATTIMPQLSVDGLLMREEGYTEAVPVGSTTTVGDAFNLTVQPYYAKSLRMFLGTSIRYDLELWDFYLQPEARAGYRYDLFADPVKLKAAFAHSGAGGVPGTEFTVVGPDPSKGNFVLGGSLAAATDSWTLGFHFDVVRGDNGAFEQVGTLTLLGRI